PWPSSAHPSTYPSQLSYWSGGFQTPPQPQIPFSPAINPTQWSYMSGATPPPAAPLAPSPHVASLSKSPSPEAHSTVA
ncbi:hypothetical protein BGZ92_007241, partial [Podila epicladia]